MAKDMKAALKAHMMKGKNAHPDAAAKGMKKGGPTTDDRMRLGRGMSRAANQKTG
jgi:gluconate kinase